MSLSNTSNGTTGAITIKSFSELANVLDVESLPPGPPDVGDQAEPTTDHLVGNAADTTTHRVDSAVAQEQIPSTEPPLDLATVIAQLASVSSGLETMARDDARAREQATVELAQYETLAAERAEAERALAQARQVRATAELLVTEAFTEQARAEAARHAAVARAAELMCAQLLAERTRAADELASRPYLARVLEERRRREREQAEARQQAEAERAERLSSGIAAARQAHRDGRLDDARAILAPLARDFPSNEEVQSVLDAVRWQAQHLRVAPAEEAVRDLARRPYREDPQAAVGRLAAVDMHGLPEELARRVFGLWSHHCLKLVRHLGMHDPRRYAPATSRGVVLARRSPDGPYEVLSALGLSGWQIGEEVTAQRIIDAAQPLEDRRSLGA